MIFPRATTVAPWTVPSHVSLLSGLYPWDHGVHAKGRLHLGMEIPWLPVLLGQRNYRTACFSGNAFLNPETGLTRGFNYAAWAAWWEPFLRGLPYPEPGHKSVPNNGSPEGGGGGRRSVNHDGVIRLVAELMHQFPSFPALLSRTIHALGQDGTGRGYPAPWIEPTFDGWLRNQPAQHAVFALVNFIDAHNPYFPAPRSEPNLWQWWKRVRASQQPTQYLRRGRSLDEEGLNSLHALYVRAIQGLDRRLESLVASLTRSGRWDNTLLIVTSDHGQAFMEDKVLFHGLTTDDAVTRVPLWIRLPRGELGGTEANGRASLVDILPTVWDIAGFGRADWSPGRSLLDFVNAERLDPVFVMSDGFLSGSAVRSWIPPNVLGRYDRIRVAAYLGDLKFHFDGSNGAPHPDGTPGDPGPRPFAPVGGGYPKELTAQMERIARKLTNGHGPPVASSLEARLGSWGYL